MFAVPLKLQSHCFQESFLHEIFLKSLKLDQIRWKKFGKNNMVSNDSKLPNSARNVEKKIQKNFPHPSFDKFFESSFSPKGLYEKFKKTRILINYYVYFDPVLTKWLGNFFNATSLSNLLCIAYFYRMKCSNYSIKKLYLNMPYKM